MEIRDKMLSVLQPLGGKEEVEELRDTIESGWWAKGPKVAKFEKEFAEMVGSKYAVADGTSPSAGVVLLVKSFNTRFRGDVSSKSATKLF